MNLWESFVQDFWTSVDEGSVYAQFLRIMLEDAPSSPVVEDEGEVIAAPPGGFLTPDMMRSYQRYLSDCIVEMEGVLGAAEMSLGKTGATLDGVNRVLQVNPTWRVIVVAPLEVARSTWPDEIMRWTHLQHLTYSVVVGDPEQRKAALARDVQITIINRENLRWLFEQIGGVRGWRWQILVYDESSRLKAWAHRTKGGKKGPGLSEFGVLAACRRKMRKVIELTGTPAPNGIIDLGGQAKILDDGKRLGTKRKHFHDRWFDTNQWTHAVTPKPHAEAEIMAAMQDVMIGLRAEDYIDLPKKIYHPVYVDLPKKIMREYREFEEHLVTEEYDVEAVSKGVLTNKLVQFCIAGGTEVLTHRGWVTIEQVTRNDLVWDGVEWVGCEGVSFNGIRPVETCFGVDMTIDHKVLTVEGWRLAEEVIYGEPGNRLERADVRLPDGVRSGRDGLRESGDVASALRVRKRDRSSKPVVAEHEPSCSEVVRMPARRAGECGTGWSYDDRAASMAHLAADEEPVSQPGSQRLPELGWSWDRHARRMVRFLRGFLAGHAEGLCRSPVDRPSGEHGVIFEGQSPLGYGQRAASEHAIEHLRIDTMGCDDRCRSGREGGSEVHHCAQAISEGGYRRSASKTRSVAVYDLVNCGPRHRFVVRGFDGPLIVHNCNGSLYRPIEGTFPVRNEIVPIHDAKLDALERILEQAKGPVLVAYGFKFDLLKIRKRFPHAVNFKDDPNFLRNWNAGKIKLAITHPASIGHGLNLQFGGHVQVWYGLTWSLEIYQQFNARLARPGQIEPNVFIYHIVARGTADEAIMDAMLSKGSTQDSITEAVRVRLGHKGYRTATGRKMADNVYELEFDALVGEDYDTWKERTRLEGGSEF